MDFRISIALLSAFGLAGCGPRESTLEERQEHVAICVNAIRSLEQPSFELGQTLNPWMRGREANLEMIEGTFRGYKVLVQLARNDIKSSRGRKLTGVEDFDAAVDEFLSYLESSEKEVAALIEIIRENNPGDFILAGNAVEMFDKLAAAERKAQERLNAESQKILSPEPSEKS